MPFALRDATPADALAVAAVHVRAWQVGYRGLLPADFLAGMSVAERAARYTFGSANPDDPATVVAIDPAGAIVGFVTTGPWRAEPAIGHLMALYVDPDRWGIGAGRALLAAGRARLHGRGHARAMLWLLAGNARAARVYAADGWRHDGAPPTRERLFGIEIDHLRYDRALP